MIFILSSRVKIAIIILVAIATIFKIGGKITTFFSYMQAVFVILGEICGF